MSHIGTYKCSLLSFNTELMKEAIEMAKQELGGEGLLDRKTVRGYDQTRKADLVFRFDGMRFSMGLKQNQEGVTFVGDAWGSEKWHTVQDIIVRDYKAVCAAVALQKLGYSNIESQHHNDPRGIIMEGSQ